MINKVERRTFVFFLEIRDWLDENKNGEETSRDELDKLQLETRNSIEAKQKKSMNKI